jgi:NADPH-dependent curcumin reductase
MTEFRRLTLARRPVGAVQPDDFAVETVPVPEPGDGEFVVRVTQIGFEPAMRGWMNDIPSYVPPVQIGEVMRAFGVGEVSASRHADFPVGTLVSGMYGWQEYALDGRGGTVASHKIPAGTPTTAALGVLGTTGLTAYFGLTEVGRPQAGDTVLVSGAAGATGSVVGQIAKILGRRLHELAPDGVNVFFDNVGGEILDAGLANIAQAGTVVLCGGISSGYSLEAKPPAIRNTSMLTVRSGRMEGFIVLNYADRFGEGVKQLATWIQEGKLVWADDLVHGTVEDCVPTLNRLFEGKNLGKQILQIGETTPAP